MNRASVTPIKKAAGNVLLPTACIPFKPHSAYIEKERLLLKAAFLFFLASFCLRFFFTEGFS